MRSLMKLGMILFTLLVTNSVFASANSTPISFSLQPGTYTSLPLYHLYHDYYDISCDVKDASGNGTDVNAIRIVSVYRPHAMSLDSKAIGWHDKTTLKTKMTGSNFAISKVRQFDDKIIIENRDFTDRLDFTCIAYLSDT